MKKILFVSFLLIQFQGLTQRADTLVIRQHLTEITKQEGYRNYRNLEQLEQIATFIESVFVQYADTVYNQYYQVEGRLYRNVICSFGTENMQRIVVGAHYDVCGDQEGADDNASGVVGLLELARLLKDNPTDYRIDLVAYTLEEPPYFRTEYMGSHVHAQSLCEKNIEVEGMISLEMIGYFKDERKTQSYPVGLLKLVYGSKGNYITLVKKWGAGKFARKYIRKYKREDLIRTKKFAAPKALPGIDFSDHLNYWKFGYSAIMITDTAFYRNKNYHKTTDTMEKLDLHRMALVIDTVLLSLLNY
ncbi:MAG: M28 family peptidase [Brumimicrobium sp.]|nr:M28 family peptidase [Brumimicrobium sp.]